MQTATPSPHFRALLFALVALALSAAPAWPGEADRPDNATVGEEAAREYNAFRDRLAKGLQQAAAGIAMRYQLDEAQRKTVQKMVAQAGESFLRDQGRKAFDLFQRAKAVGEFMREEGVGWGELPDEIKQELAGQALPLLESFTKQVNGFSGALAEVLGPEQMEKLVADRNLLETRLRKTRERIEAMGAGAPPAGGQPKAPRPPPGVVRSRPDRWEQFVRRFVRRYRLDEIQKLKAMDLLKAYRAKAAGIEAGPSSRPASQPATQPASADFRRRLRELSRRRQPLRKLFEQLKAELEKIPTPVQRRLGDSPRSRPAATTQPVARKPAPGSRVRPERRARP